MIAASIKKQDNGKYRVRWRPTPGTSRSRTFDRRKEAEAFRDELREDARQGRSVDSSAGRKITLRAFFDEWAPRQQWTPSTYDAMDLAVRTSDLADMPLASIRHSNIQGMIKRWETEYRSLRRGPLLPSTIKTRHTNIRTVLSGAVKDELLRTNPALGTKLPRVLHKSRATTPGSLPTAAQVRALIEASPSHTAPAIALAAYAGLRSAEVRAVQVGDINFLGRELHIRRQAVGTGGRVGPPKHGSARTVPLFDELLVILSERVAELGQGGPSRYLFPRPRGGDGPIAHATVADRWQAVCRTVGISGVHFHDLRHYYATSQLAHGCDVVELQRNLGHHAPSFTLDTYGGLPEGAGDRSRSAGRAAFQAGTADDADSDVSRMCHGEDGPTP